MCSAGPTELTKLFGDGNQIHGSPRLCGARVRFALVLLEGHFLLFLLSPALHVPLADSLDTARPLRDAGVRARGVSTAAGTRSAQSVLGEGHRHPEFGL